MCDSNTNSGNILTGEPPISATPPLILLQSEEESGDQKKMAAPAVSESATGEATKDSTSLSVGHDTSVTSALTTSSIPSSSSTGSSGEGTNASGSVPARNADLPWNLDNQMPEEKNPLSELTEEHLSRLDDVLASAEVAGLLQPTDLGGLNVGLGADSVGVTPSSSNTSHPPASISGLHLPDTGQLSDDSLKLDLFENQPSGSDVAVDEVLVHNYIQDSVREYESAIMNAAVSDHAYAIPTATISAIPSTTTSTVSSSTTSAVPSSSTNTATTTFSPRKSARIKQRLDDGKSMFEYDSDFEYYFTPSRRSVKKDVSEQSDADKTSSPASSSPATSTASAKQRQPKRRSVRIVDQENREKAEKILQENRQKEQEAMAALQKQKDEEEGKVNEGDEPKKDEESSPATPKRGRKLGKKAAAGKGKKGKQKQEEGKVEEEENEDTSTPKAHQPKPVGKATPMTPKGKKAKKKKEEAGGGKEDNGEDGAEKKVVSLQSGVGKLLKKKKMGKALGKAEGPGGDKKQLKLKKMKAIKKKIIKAAQTKPKKEVSSDEEDDIPLKVIAKITKNEDGKEKTPAVMQKLKKDQKPAPIKTAPHTNDKEVKKKMKQAMKPVHRKRTISDSNEGKIGPKPKEKKTESPKASSQEHGSKSESETVGKTTEKAGDKGGGSGSKTEEVTPSVVKPVKHKHRKSEEVIIDMTVTDLFKPDGVIPTEHLKKEADVPETGGKEVKEGTQGSTDLKKSVHGALVGKMSDDAHHNKNHSGTPHGRSTSTDTKSHGGTPHGRSSSTDSKNHIGTAHGRSFSTDSKSHSGTPHARSSSTDSKSQSGTPHGWSSSTDHKNHSGTLHGRSSSSDSKNHTGTPHGRSLSVEGKNASHAVHGKGISAEDKSSSKVVQSGESLKISGDAGPDRKGAFEALLTKPTVASQAETNVEHRGTAEKTSHVASAHVKTEKEHVKSLHSEHKEHKHSISKKQKTSHHHHEETKKPQEHHKHTHHVKKKEESQPKEERKSLFEILTKSEDLSKELGKESETHHKKDRKGSTEKKHKERKTSKDDGHESGGDLSYEDDENDSDWEPSNDVGEMYCICRKPHGNRFMICCDQCEEWFHGQCVGVTKQQGKQMEEERREYICPKCSGKPVDQIVAVKHEPKKLNLASTPSSKEKSASGEARKKSRSSTDDAKTLKKPVSGKDKWKTQRCIVEDCKHTARLGSVYCGNGCIIRHARLALRQIRLDKEKASGQQVSDFRPSEKHHVAVTERRSGTVLSGPKAPTEAQLELWLRTHPSFQVLQANISNTSTFYGKKKDRRSSSSAGKKVEEKADEKQDGSGITKTEEKKEGEAAGSKPPGTDEGSEKIRHSVRTSLQDALASRAKEAGDIVLSSSEVKRLALRIEEELFKLFTNTGQKYRTKFRSLVFNIKDQKNKGLFRKILTRRIRSAHLVRMSTEELASKELSNWRKMENKHALAMIEQTEKEALKEGQHIRKKTHKGEVEVEEEDMSTLVTHVEEQKSVPESKQEEEEPSTAVDTTDQHRAHLFDLNCKICTGKVLPPTTEEPVVKKLKVAHEVMEEPKLLPRKESKKKEVTIRGDVKILEIKPDEQMAEEEEEGEHSTTPQTTTMSPEETVSTPSSAVSSSPGPPHATPGSSAGLTSSGPTHTSQVPAISSRVTVRSPDSALQSGLDPKHKFTPSGPMVWKGFISMQDFAKFFTSAYRVSGPADKLGLPDTLQICGRIGPEHMWDYLGKIRQAGSRDVCILRFIPGSDDEKVAYVHLYSYLNSRSRCGVVGNPPKHVKDLYIVPLASHSKIPQVLLPFDGPGLEGNRPHMLIGIVVRQKLKRPKDNQEGSTPGKPSHSAVKSSGAASPKKIKLSKDETEAYSPTADDDDEAAPQALYIPTPTSNIARVAVSSASSSSSSTPSSTLLPNQSADSSSEVASSASAVKEAVKIEDAEPYSPGKPFETDDGDAPYDPEDVDDYDDGVKSKKDTKKAVSSSSAPAVVVTTSTCASATATVVSSTPAVVAAPPSQPSTVSSTPSVNIDNVMHQISSSSNPQEISSLMVAVLAQAKDSTEQQHLLATLTSKVEQQKKQQGEKQIPEESAPPSTDSVALATAGTIQAGLASVSTPDVSVSVSSTTKDYFAVSSSAVSPLPAAVGVSPIVTSILDAASAAAAASSTTTSVSSTSTSSSVSTSVVSASPAVSVVSSATDNKSTVTTTSRISSLTPDTEDMPLALKALMEDLKGNMQMVRAVDKRTERDRREREKREASTAKEAESEKKEVKEVMVKDTQLKESAPVIPGLGESQDSDTVIPGLGGAPEEIPLPVVEESVSASGKDKSDEVSSSTDQRYKDGLTPPGLGAEVGLGDTDLRSLGDPAVVNPVLDQDERFPHFPLPEPLPPPLSHGADYHPPPSSYMLPPAHPGVLPPPHPALDVADVDHRRPIPPPMYAPRPPPSFAPSTFIPSRKSAQPPPPGTELVEEGDVDMRQAPKRGGPHHSDSPLEKMPRSEPPGPSRLVPPLPPLPPQPPPPLPPLPSSSVDIGGQADVERYDRADPGHRSHSHEHWHRSHEGGHDYDHRRHHHDPHSGFSHRSHHHHRSGHSHSPSPPSRYRGDGLDRDERHRRDRHFHRDRH